MSKKKGGKVKWIIIGVIIVAILGGVFATKEDEEPKKVGEVGDSSNNNDTSSNKDETEGKNEFVVGDIVESKNLRITFISAQEYISKNEFITPEEGKIFYRVEFEFENIGDEDEYISSMVGFECYADGYSCNQTFVDENDDLSATLSSGKKTRGAVYYEVPKDTTEIVIEYKDNFLLDDKVIFKAK